jgi:hypothetical protein
MEKPSDPEVSKRQLLRIGLTATTASFLIGGLEVTFPEQAHAQSALTPDAALAELTKGNKRFMSGRTAPAFPRYVA